MALMLITLLAIMMILVAANSMAVNRLHQEVKLLQQNQLKRLDGTSDECVSGQSRHQKIDSKMNNDTAIKIAMIKGSMRCFAFGMLGLLPFIGLPFAGL